MTVQTTRLAMMPMRHVALGVLRFLGRRRDGVEADVGEEDDRRRASRCRAKPFGANGVQFSGFT